MHLTLVLTVLLLAATAAHASLIDNGQGEVFRSVGSIKYRGAALKRFRSEDGNEIIEPYISFNIRGKQNIRKNVLGQGFYFTLPLSVDSRLSGAGRSSSSRVLQLVSFKVSLRRSLVASWCKNGCGEVGAAGFRNAAGKFKILFRCKQRAVCRRVFESLYFDSADSDLVRAAFSFSFNGFDGSSRLTLSRVGLPVSGVASITDRPLSNAHWFEGNKVLLYQIKAGCGQQAYDSFERDLGYRMAADGSWPDVFRSPLLDNLPAAVGTSQQWQIVAEMRTAGNMVAQVVFDVNRRRKSLSSTNWFSANRVVSSYPYFIGQTGYNYFSVAGHASVKRRFFINNKYGGCVNERGFWVVSDQRDGCPWANRGWKGRAPVLAYNSVARTKYQSGATKYADQFLVYLRYSVPALAPRVRNMFRNDFEFEKGKLLLYTVKAYSNVHAYNTFVTPKVYAIPHDNSSLPSVWRSGFLDNLPVAMADFGKRHIVAEMRKNGDAVARVVFKPIGSYDKFNWFSAANIADSPASMPFQLGRTETYNYFSVRGHAHRHFYINFSSHGGCNRERGSWAILDGRGGCSWESRGWTGRGPTLVYNSDRATSYFNSGRLADRFLIYLQD